MASQLPQILAIEDDDAIRTGVVDALAFAGYSVRECRNGDEGLRLANQSDCDLILLDLILPGASGLKILVDEIEEILPEFELTPVENGKVTHAARMLATLPVELRVKPSETITPGWSAIHMSLLVAWSCLGLAFVMSAGAIHGVITLSERRGAFVSAVTHELRTPLTTFRIYSEMLAKGMVPSREKQQHYLNTLQQESDRLSHLVENVLSYAQLERGTAKHRTEALSVESFVDRIGRRLEERAQQAGLELKWQIQSLDARLATDPGAVEQILFNLVDNACKYASGDLAERAEIEIAIVTDNQEAVFRVCDYGPGIPSRQARYLFRPFSKSVHDAANSAPGVGLGLALSTRLARELGGQLRMVESDNVPATFELYLPKQDVA